MSIELFDIESTDLPNLPTEGLDALVLKAMGINIIAANQVIAKIRAATEVIQEDLKPNRAVIITAQGVFHSEVEFLEELEEDTAQVEIEFVEACDNARCASCD